MSLVEQYKSFSNKLPWIARILAALLVLVVLLTLIRVPLPFVINIAATSWFESEGVEAKILDVQYISTNEQIADIFTKSLGKMKGEKFTSALLDNI